MEQLSYLHAPASVPFIYASIPDLLDEKAKSYPDKEVYVFYSYSDEDKNVPVIRKGYTYKDVEQSSLSVAAWLLRSGVKSGDRIAMFGTASPAKLFLDMAALRLKVVLMRLPATNGFWDYIKKYKVRMLFVEPEVDKDEYEQIKDTPNFNKYLIPNDDNFKIVLCQDHSLEPHILVEHTQEENTSILEIQKTIDPEEGAIVFPTSGTTGLPKMVLMSHMCFIQVCLYYKTGTTASSIHGESVHFFNNRPYTWLASVPHLPAVMAWTLITASPVLITDPNRIANLVELLERETVNVAVLPSFILKSFVQMQVHLPKSLTSALCVGEPLPSTLMNNLLRNIPNISNGYGATEALGAESVAEIAMDDSDIAQAQYFSPIKGAEVKIVSPEGGTLPCGQTGFVCLRGPASFLGYLDDQEATEQKKSSTGWVNLGDLGVVDSPGGLRIIGRPGEMIAKGPCKVYPFTIEQMLSKCPGVDRAIAVSIPHDRYGQDIAACVLSKSGSELTHRELTEHCRIHGTKTFNIELYPQTFRIVSEFPKLQNGKDDRVQIAEWLR